MVHDLSETELMAYKALYKHQGARIMFKCDQVTYQGIIDLILPDNRQVKLRHTKVVEENEYLGNLRFRFLDVAHFTVVESVENVNRFPKNDYLMNILRNNRPVKNDCISKALYGDNLSDQSDDEDIDKEKNEEHFVLDVPDHLKCKLPNDYAVIDILSDDFNQAVRYIASQQVIGVSFDDPVISRFGKFSWICVSTEVCLFLFDIQQLGKEAFDKGLRHIFENESIKKVIHDCRFPSDCLDHQYATLLTNVFDTRVADFFINQQQYHDKYEFKPFSSLDCCLRNYLEVPQEFLFKRDLQEDCRSKRPINKEKLYDLLKNVLYLKLLHEKLSRALLAPLYRATNFCCNVLSKASQEVIDTLGSDLSKPDSIPQCLLMNGIQTVCFRKPQEKQHISLGCTFLNSQTGKTVDSKATFHTPAAVKNLKDKKQSETSLMFIKRRVKNSETNQKKNPISNKTVLSDTVSSFTEDIKSLSIKPSFRHMDEVYHKLINRKYSDQLDSVINVKPSINYISTFSVKQPPLFCTNAVLDSSANISGKITECELDESSKSRFSPFDKDVKTWSKICSEFIDEETVLSSTQSKQSKIRFVPG